MRSRIERRVVDLCKVRMVPRLFVYQSIKLHLLRSIDFFKQSRTKIDKAVFKILGRLLVRANRKVELVGLSFSNRFQNTGHVAVVFVQSCFGNAGLLREAFNANAIKAFGEKQLFC